MRDPHDLTADLPPPRDDEPASLRRDIVDELRDHLACALHRELHHSRGCTSADQSHHTARQRVLTRFGNPAAIARRLWWDAMKETIMSQRITAGMASLAALACCAMFVLMWQTQAANRALVQESQALNARLLEQMQALAEGLRPAGEGDQAPSEWNRLRLKCVADGEKGAPLAGVRARLESASENTRGIPPTMLTTGDDGLLDFGQVLYGQYELHCTAPNEMTLRKTISVRPGQDLEETVVCPTGAAPALITIRPELPGDPEPEEIRGRVWYRFELGRWSFDSGQWSRPLSGGNRYEIVNWFVAPDGRMMALGPTSEAQTKIEVSAGAESGVSEPLAPRPA